MLTPRSQSDFDHTKKAEYYDAEGFAVADKDNKHKLQKPEKLEAPEQNKE